MGIYMYNNQLSWCHSRYKKNINPSNICGFMLNELSWKVIVHFVDIVDIGDHHSLNFLFHIFVAQARTWISSVIICGLFYVQWVEVKCDFSFCWYWWHCWPSQFNLYFHNQSLILYYTMNFSCVFSYLFWRLLFLDQMSYCHYLTSVISIFHNLRLSNHTANSELWCLLQIFKS